MFWQEGDRHIINLAQKWEGIVWSKDWNDDIRDMDIEFETTANVRSFKEDVESNLDWCKVSNIY